MPRKQISDAELLKQKRLSLKQMKRDSDKAAAQGRHSWADYYRNQHIKELSREIQLLKEKINKANADNK